jgi:tRNA/rRNA methyltransferase
MKDQSPLENLRVVLSRPRHPGNIGATARAMKTMGVMRLDLVRPGRFPDPEADALASGADDVLASARVHEKLAGALEGCVLVAGFTSRPRDLSHPPRALRDAATELAAAARESAVALVFGNETTGLSNAELSQCQRMVMIPASSRYASLNLAAAVQVACYELAVAASAHSLAPARSRKRAKAEDVEALHAHIEQAMIASGFLRPAHPGRLMQRLRRLAARVELEKEEVAILRGMLASFERRRAEEG